MAEKARKPKSVYDQFPPPKYKVGDWVSYSISHPHPRIVQLIGYRGPSVRYGHRYRYRHIDEFGQVRESELTEADIEPAAPPDPLPVPAPTTNHY